MQGVSPDADVELIGEYGEIEIAPVKPMAVIAESSIKRTLL
jgi:hypothetical protein